jgi:formyl-CoA transferase
VLSESPVEITSSPLLGEHTAGILREVMGCDDAELERLRAEGVI